MLLLALKEQVLLPRAIVFMPDDDIIKQCNIPIREARAGMFKIILEYLLEETHRVIASYKEKLPSRSKQEYFPQVLWMVPPQHKYFNNNEMRDLFANALESEIDKYPGMCALRLKKIWEENEGSLYLREQLRYTQEGNICYW